MCKQEGHKILMMLAFIWSDMIRTMPVVGGYFEIQTGEMKLRMVKSAVVGSGQRILTHNVSQPLYLHWTAVLLFLRSLSMALPQIHAVTSSMSLVRRARPDLVGLASIVNSI